MTGLEKLQFWKKMFEGFGVQRKPVTKLQPRIQHSPYHVILYKL